MALAWILSELVARSEPAVFSAPATVASASSQGPSASRARRRWGRAAFSRSLRAGLRLRVFRCRLGLLGRPEQGQIDDLGLGDLFDPSDELAPGPKDLGGCRLVYDLVVQGRQLLAGVSSSFMTLSCVLVGTQALGCGSPDALARRHKFPYWY